MNTRIGARLIVVLLLVAIMLLALGWTLRGWWDIGEQAMGEFMTEYSALAYLDKGNVQSAQLILRYSAERSLLTSEEFGTPRLDWHREGARYNWFSRYGELRERLPSKPRSAADDLNPAFDEEVEAVLRKARQKKLMAD